jgi:hypothetical protein
MFGKFFDTTEIDVFAHWVSAELQKAVAPAECEARSHRADARVQRLNERVARRATELVAATRLNVYKKAKLGTQLQELLAAAGYPAGFAKQFSYDVAALVATAGTERA